MKRIVLLIIGALFIIFIAQNTQVVELHFLFWTTQASRILVLLGTFAAGFIFGWISGRLR